MKSALLVLLCTTVLLLYGTEPALATVHTAVALYVLQTPQYQSSEASMVYTNSTTGKTENIEPVAMCPFVKTCFGVRVPRGPIFQIPTNARDIRVVERGQTDLKVNNPRASGVFIQAEKGSEVFNAAPGYTPGRVRVLKVRLYNLNKLPKGGGRSRPDTFAAEKLSPFATYTIHPPPNEHTSKMQQIGFALQRIEKSEDSTNKKRTPFDVIHKRQKPIEEKHTIFAIPSGSTLAFCFGYSMADAYNLRNHTEICYTPPMRMLHQELEISGGDTMSGKLYEDPNNSKSWTPLGGKIARLGETTEDMIMRNLPEDKLNAFYKVTEKGGQATDSDKKRLLEAGETLKREYNDRQLLENESGVRRSLHRG